MRLPHRLFAAVSCTLLMASQVHAQFISAINRPSFSTYDTSLFLNDLGASTSQRFSSFEALGIALATAPGFRGLAGDDVNGRFFGISDVQTGGTTGTNLVQVSYGGKASLVNRPFQVLPNGDAQMQLNGVAYDTRRAELYVFRNQAQNVAALGGWIQGGLFRVNLATGLMTATNLVGPAQGTNLINVRSIAYDNLTDRIYLSQSRVGTPLEIFSWNPANGNTESVLNLATLGFADSRAPMIGAGGGKLMLLSQAAGHLGGMHREFDLLTRSFTANTVATPYGAYGLFAGSPVIASGGVAYVPSIPEPAGVVLLGMGLALLGWRERRAGHLVLSSHP